MPKIHKATASPLEVLVKGERYAFSQLTTADNAELQTWLQHRFIDLAKKGVEGECVAVQVEVLSNSIKEAARLTLGCAETEQIMEGDISVIAHFFWLSLRHEHPDITKEQVFDIMGDPGAIEMIDEKFDAITKAITSKKVSRRLRKLTKKRPSARYWFLKLLGFQGR